MFRMLWNTIKDGLCYLRNESVSMKDFLLNMHELRILFDLGKPTRHLIYYAYYIYSGNANTGSHCLLLQFHLSYCIIYKLDV